jgi:hypothetical protein
MHPLATLLRHPGWRPANGRKGARADEEPDRLPWIRYPTLGIQELCNKLRVLVTKGFSFA